LAKLGETSRGPWAGKEHRCWQFWLQVREFIGDDQHEWEWEEDLNTTQLLVQWKSKPQKCWVQALAVMVFEFFGCKPCGTVVVFFLPSISSTRLCMTLEGIGTSCKKKELSQEIGRSQDAQISYRDMS